MGTGEVCECDGKTKVCSVCDPEYVMKTMSAEIDRLENQVDRLRGQLQNCVNHLNRAKRSSYGKQAKSFDDCMEQANKALYETLIG